MYTSAFRYAYQAGAGVSQSSGVTARKAERQADQVEARCERLAMLCEAMWTLMSEKLSVTDEELIDRINEIDLRDGKLDGRVARDGPMVCHKCERPIAERFPKCMYCGAPVARSPFV